MIVQVYKTGFTAIDTVQLYRRNVHGQNITHVKKQVYKCTYNIKLVPRLIKKLKVDI